MLWGLDMVGGIKFNAKIDLSGITADLKKITSTQHKINISPIIPKVDFKPLHDLNNLLDVKQKHLRETSNYYQNNPIKPKVDLVELNSLQAALKELDNKNVKVNVDVDTTKLESLLNQLKNMNMSLGVSSSSSNRGANTSITLKDSLSPSFKSLETLISTKLDTINATLTKNVESTKTLKTKNLGTIFKETLNKGIVNRANSAIRNPLKDLNIEGEIKKLIVGSFSKAANNLSKSIGSEMEVEEGATRLSDAMQRGVIAGIKQGAKDIKAEIASEFGILLTPSGATPASDRGSKNDRSLSNIGARNRDIGLVGNEIQHAKKDFESLIKVIDKFTTAKQYQKLNAQIGDLRQDQKHLNSGRKQINMSGSEADRKKAEVHNDNITRQVDIIESKIKNIESRDVMKQYKSLETQHNDLARKIERLQNDEKSYRENLKTSLKDLDKLTLKQLVEAFQKTSSELNKLDKNGDLTAVRASIKKYDDLIARTSKAIESKSKNLAKYKKKSHTISLNIADIKMGDNPNSDINKKKIEMLEQQKQKADSIIDQATKDLFNTKRTLKSLEANKAGVVSNAANEGGMDANKIKLSLKSQQAYIKQTIVNRNKGVSSLIGEISRVIGLDIGQDQLPKIVARADKGDGFQAEYDVFTNTIQLSNEVIAKLGKDIMSSKADAVALLSHELSHGIQVDFNATKNIEIDQGVRKPKLVHDLSKITQKDMIAIGKMMNGYQEQGLNASVKLQEIDAYMTTLKTKQRAVASKKVSGSKGTANTVYNAQNELSTYLLALGKAQKTAGNNQNVDALINGIQSGNQIKASINKLKALSQSQGVIDPEGFIKIFEAEMKAIADYRTNVMRAVQNSDNSQDGSLKIGNFVSTLESDKKKKPRESRAKKTNENVNKLSTQVADLGVSALQANNNIKRLVDTLVGVPNQTAKEKPQSSAITTIGDDGIPLSQVSVMPKPEKTNLALQAIQVMGRSALEATRSIYIGSRAVETFTMALIPGANTAKRVMQALAPAAAIGGVGMMVPGAGHAMLGAAQMSGNLLSPAIGGISSALGAGVEMAVTNGVTAAGTLVSNMIAQSGVVGAGALSSAISGGTAEIAGLLGAGAAGTVAAGASATMGAGAIALPTVMASKAIGDGVGNAANKLLAPGGENQKVIEAAEKNAQQLKIAATAVKQYVKEVKLIETTVTPLKELDKLPTGQRKMLGQKDVKQLTAGINKANTAMIANANDTKATSELARAKGRLTNALNARLRRLKKEGINITPDIMSLKDVKQKMAERRLQVETSVNQKPMQNLKNITRQSGNDFKEGFKNEIQQHSEVVEVARVMGQDAVKGLRQGIDAHSPSKKTEKEGDNFIDGFIKMLKKRAGDVVFHARLIGNKAVSALNLGIRGKQKDPNNVLIANAQANMSRADVAMGDMEIKNNQQIKTDAATEDKKNKVNNAKKHAKKGVEKIKAVMDVVLNSNSLSGIISLIKNRFASLKKLISKVGVSGALKFGSLAIAGYAAFKMIGMGIRTLTRGIGDLFFNVQKNIDSFTKLFSLSKKFQSAGMNNQAGFNIAQEQGISLQAVSSQAGVTSALKRQLGVKKAAEVAADLSKGLQAQGLMGDDLSGAMLAFSQIGSKGKFYAEEGMQLKERLPAIRQLTEDAMGVSSTQLEEMQKSGQILAVEYLPAMAKQLKKAGIAAELPTAELQRAKNNVEGIRAGLGKGSLNISRAPLKLFNTMIGQGIVLNGLVSALGVSIVAFGSLGAAAIAKVVMGTTALKWGLLRTLVMIKKNKMAIIGFGATMIGITAGIALIGTALTATFKKSKITQELDEINKKVEALIKKKDKLNSPGQKKDRFGYDQNKTGVAKWFSGDLGSRLTNFLSGGGLRRKQENEEFIKGSEVTSSFNKVIGQGYNSLSTAPKNIAEVKKLTDQLNSKKVQLFNLGNNKASLKDIIKTKQEIAAINGKLSAIRGDYQSIIANAKLLNDIVASDEFDGYDEKTKAELLSQQVVANKQATNAEVIQQEMAQITRFELPFKLAKASLEAAKTDIERELSNLEIKTLQESFGSATNISIRDQQQKYNLKASESNVNTLVAQEQRSALDSMPATVKAQLESLIGAKLSEASTEQLNQALVKMDNSKEKLSSELKTAVEMEKEVRQLETNNLKIRAELLRMESQLAAAQSAKSLATNLGQASSPLAQIRRDAINSKISLEGRPSEIDAYKTGAELAVFKDRLAAINNSLGGFKGKTQDFAANLLGTDDLDSVSTEQLQAIKAGNSNEINLNAERQEIIKQIEQYVSLNTQIDNMRLASAQANRKIEANQSGRNLSTELLNASSPLAQIRRDAIDKKVALNNRPININSSYHERSIRTSKIDREKASAEMKVFDDRLSVINKSLKGFDSKIQEFIFKILGTENLDDLSSEQIQAARAGNAEEINFDPVKAEAFKQAEKYVTLNTQKNNLRVQASQGAQQIASSLRSSVKSYISFIKSLSDKLVEATAKIEKQKLANEQLIAQNDIKEANLGKTGYGKKFGEIFGGLISSLNGVANEELSLEDQRRANAKSLRDLKTRYYELNRQLQPLLATSLELGLKFEGLGNATQKLTQEMSGAAQNLLNDLVNANANTSNPTINGITQGGADNPGSMGSGVYNPSQHAKDEFFTMPEGNFNISNLTGTVEKLEDGSQHFYVDDPRDAALAAAQTALDIVRLESNNLSGDSAANAEQKLINKIDSIQKDKAANPFNASVDMIKAAYATQSQKTANHQSMGDYQAPQATNQYIEELAEKERQLLELKKINIAEKLRTVVLDVRDKFENLMRDISDKTESLTFQAEDRKKAIRNLGERYGINVPNEVDKADRDVIDAYASQRKTLNSQEKSFKRQFNLEGLELIKGDEEATKNSNKALISSRLLPELNDGKLMQEALDSVSGNEAAEQKVESLVEQLKSGLINRSEFILNIANQFDEDRAKLTTDEQTARFNENKKVTEARDNRRLDFFGSQKSRILQEEQKGLLGDGITLGLVDDKVGDTKRQLAEIDILKEKRDLIQSIRNNKDLSNNEKSVAIAEAEQLAEDKLKASENDNMPWLDTAKEGIATLKSEMASFIDGSKSLWDALGSTALSVLGNIAQQVALSALNSIGKGADGGGGSGSGFWGQLAGAAISSLSEGYIPNYANGGVDEAMALAHGVNRAFKKENHPKAFLAVMNRDEAVLSAKNQDAQTYARMRQNGDWAKYKRGYKQGMQSVSIPAFSSGYSPDNSVSQIANNQRHTNNSTTNNTYNYQDSGFNNDDRSTRESSAQRMRREKRMRQRYDTDE